jgi:lysyl-tRNA synthetase class 2
MSEKRENSSGKVEQRKIREEKMKKLAQAGVELFPNKIEVTHSIYEVVSKYGDYEAADLEKEKQKVKVAGRITSIREMGRAVFFHIKDSQEKLQGYIRKDRVGDKKFELFSLLDIGDVIAIEGVIFKTRTNELTVLLDSFDFLAKCLYPLPEKWHGLRDIELRYRKRYLDLIVNPEVTEVFRLRSRMIALIRDFFNKKGYVEVETPMMHPIPGGALAKPFKTFHNALGVELYLRIAPELYLKRLVVGGMEKVYEINRNFRNEGISSEHNPEFTMLEFYEAFCDYNDMMNITEDLISQLSLELTGKEEVMYGENKISFKKPWKRIRFMDSLSRYSGLAPSRFDDKEGIIKFASELSGEDTFQSYGKALDVIFDKYVKPNLIQPTFVINPPKEISPLAKASKDNPDEAERFELIIAGMEIANAFSELTDPIEQKKRFLQQAEERKKGDEESHVVDHDYVKALEYGLPPTGGNGIGIDRLVMIFTDRHSIREVILFPLLRPKEGGDKPDSSG